MNATSMEVIKKAILLLDEELNSNQNSDISIGDVKISWSEAKEMKSKFESLISGESKIKKVFKAVPIRLAISNPFWRKVQIVLRDEYVRSIS